MRPELIGLPSAQQQRHVDRAISHRRAQEGRLRANLRALADDLESLLEQPCDAVRRIAAHDLARALRQLKF